MSAHPPADETADESADETLTTAVSLFAALRGLSGAAVADVRPPSTWHLLKLLSGPAPLRMADLAALSGLDASTVSRHVRALEDDGLLERCPDATDRRSCRLAVTRQGQDAYADALGRRAALVGRATRDWTPGDRRALSTLLARLAGDLASQET